MGEIFMPKMGDAMTEGKVVRWYKQPGDPVKKGEPVLEIETDKVNLDLESEDDGVLDEIKVQEGGTASVGETLATTRGSEGERDRERETERGERAAKAPSPQVPTPSPQKQRPQLRAVENPAPPQQSGKSSSRAGLRSSPLARRMAREMGVDLASIQGSGPAGRIIAADIEGVSSQPRSSQTPRPERQPSGPPAALETKTVPLSAMRKTIAKRLVESIGPIPHFYLTIDLDVSDLLSLRAQLSEVENVKASVNDFIIRAAALAIRRHPNVNASFMGDAIQQYGEIHIGVAVATPEGLITPVVREADTKSVADIAREVRDLAERAKNRRLKPNEYQGGTFTISNLGMFGIEEFTAIINPPNAAILAIGAATPRPVAMERKIMVRDRMKVTMSCDHRVIDGAAGAQYLQTLRQYIEQPIRLIL